MTSSVSRLLTVASLCLSIAAQAADLTAFKPQPGASKVTVVGTSTTAGISSHDWSVGTPLITGSMDLDSTLVEDPSKAKPGKVDAKVQVVVPARQLRSAQASKLMDDVMHEALKAQQYPRIEFRLTELTLKETPKAADAPIQFESKGELAVAGVTNQIAFPVTISREAGDKLKVSGSASLKMSSYKVTPRPPKLAMGLVKTGDDIKINFEWLVAKEGAKTDSAASK
jgi:polyisoprenoid-binding protein YceI